MEHAKDMLNDQKPTKVQKQPMGGQTTMSSN